MLHLLTILTLLSLTSAVTYEGPGNLDCLGSPSVTCEFGSNLSLGTLQSGPTSVANFGGDDNNKNDFKVDIISGSVDCDGSCVFTADGAVPTPTGSPGPPETTGSTAAPVSEPPIVPPSVVTYEGPGNLDCLGSPSVTCEFGSNLSLGTLQSGPTSVANFGGDDNNKNDFKVDIISGSVDCDGSCVFTADGAVPTPTGSPGPPEPTAAPVSESPIVPPSSAPKIEFLVTAVVTTLAVFFVSINTA
mmetsp:Transcript_31941/g.47145  ORF Transcript_31941/g.47145 Transcript_31941/m.47145 type:complete len:245 (+) Transcript_31941:77-811(+)